MFIYPVFPKMEGVPQIDNVRKRIKELDALMAAPDFFQNARKAADLSREHGKLGKLVNLHSQLEKSHDDIAENQAIVNDADADADLKLLAEEELPGLCEQFEAIKDSVIVSMIPPDPSDSRNTIMEVRAGTGGDEASLFSGDLYRMYCRYADIRGWKVELLGSSLSGANGFKEVSFLVSGEDVYKTLKYESGVHRVQRVPVTEASGRIHTSTATVAVLPEAEEVDVQIDPGDLEITVCRASGPGGQSVNTTDSAVQIVHKPTGLTVYCADERSQLKNKNKALTVLRARLLKKEEEEELAKYAENRRSQIGTGDRSERIRTYNFPQSRLTDHRIGLSLHNLPEFMQGQIDEMLTALQQTDQQEKIKLMLDAAGQTS